MYAEDDDEHVEKTYRNSIFAHGNIISPLYKDRISADHDDDEHIEKISFWSMKIWTCIADFLKQSYI